MEYVCDRLYDTIEKARKDAKIYRRGSIAIYEMDIEQNIVKLMEEL
jgi:hypothetical protein